MRRDGAQRRRTRRYDRQRTTNFVHFTEGAGYGERRTATKRVVLFSITAVRGGMLSVVSMVVCVVVVYCWSAV